MNERIIRTVIGDVDKSRDINDIQKAYEYALSMFEGSEKQILIDRYDRVLTLEEISKKYSIRTDEIRMLEATFLRYITQWPRQIKDWFS